jgi:hypothetical protein
MRRIRSIAAVISTLAVMACQTAVSMSAPVQPVPVSSVSASPGVAVAAATPAIVKARATAAAPAADGSNRRTLIIVGILALVVIGAALIFSGGDGGLGGY